MSFLLFILAFSVIQGHVLGEHPRIVCERKYFSLADFGTAQTKSPAGTAIIFLQKDGSLRVERHGKTIGTIPLPDVAADIKIAWAPDSQKLAVTYSDGGAEGLFHAHVYKLDETHVTELSKPIEVAFADFKAQYYCERRGNNIYVEGWSTDSNALLVITGVYPTSDCGKNFGRLGAYFIDLQGNIIRRYSDADAEALQSSCEKVGGVSLP